MVGQSLFASETEASRCQKGAKTMDGLASLSFFHYQLRKLCPTALSHCATFLSFLKRWTRQRSKVLMERSTFFLLERIRFVAF